MGKTDRVHRDSPAEAAVPAGRRAAARLARSVSAVSGRRPARAGLAVHGLRDPVLPSGLSARQPDPRLERFRLPRPVGSRERAAARDEQLPRVDGPAVSGAVRGIVRARHQRLAGHDQGRRGHDRRARVRRRLGRRAAAGRAHRQARRRRRIRAGRPGGGRPAEPRRPLGHRVRARRSDRRAAALRHPRVQAREEVPRTPAGRHARRGRDVPDQRQRRRRTCRCPSCARASRPSCSPAGRRFRAI